MDYRKLIKASLAFAFVCAQLAFAGNSPVAKSPAKKQEDKRAGKQPSALKEATIVVNDRALAGPSSSPERRGSRIFLPVVSIARALGDTPSVNQKARSIEVQRQTGAVAAFSAELNHILENGTAILVVSNTADIVFPPNQDELMLPVEIVGPLLDVSIIVDEASRAVRIRRGLPQVDSVRPGTQHGAWELYQADYTSNINVYSSSANYNLTLHSAGRINDGKFDFQSNFDGTPGQNLLALRRGSFAFDRRNGQRFIIGDFGTGNDLEFMSATVRGISAQKPVGDMRVSVIAGRSMSDSSLRLSVLPDPVTGSLPEGDRFAQANYDTTVLGSYVTFGPSVKDPARQTLLLFSSGAMHFSGPLASGNSLLGGVKYGSRRHQLQGDFGFGNFSGTSFNGFTPEGRPVNGFAPMIDVTESFNLTDNLKLQGRLTRIGENFLSAQTSGLLRPVSLLSGGASWRVTRWLSASINTISRTQTDATDQGERSVSASLSVTPQGWLPTFIFNHTQGETLAGGKNSYTLANLTKEFSRWRLFGNFTRIQNSHVIKREVGDQSSFVPPSASVTAGAMVKIGDTQTLQFSQSFSSGDNLGGSVDWMTSSLFTNKISFGAGFSYNYSNTGLLTTERFLTTLTLPRKHVLQFVYVQTPDGPQLIAQLRGTLFESARAEAALNAPVAEFNTFGSFYGRVYQDINLNGQFDGGVDRPISNVSVRVDGSYFALSDTNGEFRVENVKAGEHTVYLDLLSVRADLTLLDSPQQVATLKPGRDSIVDFRLVRTGRIRGVVWMDVNGNGKLDENEPPASDVRVVMGSGRDTLTDGNGEFILNDIPPGEHTLLIDEKTLPENTKPAVSSLQVIVKAAGETGGVVFPIVAKLVEVDIKRFPSK